MMELRLYTFVGTELTIEAALDAVTGQVNRWLASHQWRTTDGMGSYTFATTVVSYGMGWQIVITAYGPAGETPPQPATGATVRLDQ
jgi:hypothetical protein